MARNKAEGSERRAGAAEKQARRKWSVGEKVRMVQEVERTGAAVSEIARRHGAHVSMLTRWRAQYRGGQLGAQGSPGAKARLVPVRVLREAPPASRRTGDLTPAVTATGAIEVQLAGGQRVCIRGTVDAGMLRAVLEEVARS